MSIRPLILLLCIISIAALLAIGTARRAHPTIDLVAQHLSPEPDVPDTIAELLGQGDRLRATQQFDQAIKVYASVIDRTSEGSLGRARALIGQGRIAKSQGEFYVALAVYRRALEIFRSLDEVQGQTMALHNMGSCFTAIGELKLARDHYEAALDLATIEAKRAVTLSHLATLDDLEGNHALARQNFRAALVLRMSNLGESTASRLHGKAVILDRLGSAVANLEPSECLGGCREKALLAYRSAAQILERLDRPRDLSVTIGNLGFLALDHCTDSPMSCDPSEALHFFEDALETMVARAYPNAWIALVTGKVRALRYLDDLPAAEALALQGIERVEVLRAQELQPLLEVAFSSRHRPLYDELVSILVRRHRQSPGDDFLQRALEIVESTRARGLLERILESSSTHGTQGVPDSARWALQRALNALERQRLMAVDNLSWRLASSPETMTETLESIADIEKEQRLLLLRVKQGRVEQDRVQGPRSDHAPGFDVLNALGELLDEQTVFLVFSLGQDEGFLWWIDHTRMSVFDLPGFDGLEPRIHHVHGALATSAHLQTREQQQGREAALRSLSQILLGPIADRLHNHRLVIFADGALHTLPFAPLLNPRHGRPLIQDHELVMLPSISTLMALRQREARRSIERPVTGQPLLTLVTDPIYNADDPRLAHQPECLDHMPAVSDLPATEQEGRVIRRWVRAGGWDWTEPKATREALLQGMASTSPIVHLAVHGALDRQRPDFSHLVFSRFDTMGRCLDNRLFVHEISGLRFRADLMVLSACDTGRGKIVRGEGVLGMTRAMLAAGASRSLVSLWPVDDRATAVLMGHFYRSLLEEDATPAQALQRAQQSMLQSQDFAEPMYWAGFVLVGDWTWPGLPGRTSPDTAGPQPSDS